MRWRSLPPPPPPPPAPLAPAVPAPPLVPVNRSAETMRVGAGRSGRARRTGCTGAAAAGRRTAATEEATEHAAGPRRSAGTGARRHSPNYRPGGRRCTRRRCRRCHRRRLARTPPPTPPPPAHSLRWRSATGSGRIPRLAWPGAPAGALVPAMPGCAVMSDKVRFTTDRPDGPHAVGAAAGADRCPAVHLGVDHVRQRAAADEDAGRVRAAAAGHQGLGHVVASPIVTPLEPAVTRTPMASPERAGHSLGADAADLRVRDAAEGDRGRGAGAEDRGDLAVVPKSLKSSIPAAADLHVGHHRERGRCRSLRPPG